MLAFTGLETVANLAEEARRPGIDIPRSVFGAIGTVVTLYVAIAIVGISAFPGPQTELGTRWIRAPLLGIADRLRSELPWYFGDVLRVYVGITGALILLVAVTTSISGFSRLAYSLGEHGQLPRSFGRLSRRAHVSPQAITSATLIASAIVIWTSFLKNDVAFLASLFSFGVLLAFTAAQLAVIKLRVDALATHRGARYAGPVWLAVGVVVYVAVRMAHGEGLMERVEAPDERPLEPSVTFTKILVPMKLGVIGEEMLATAVRLASDHAAEVQALYVIRVPLEQPLDAEMIDAEESAEASLAEAKLLGADHGVNVEGAIVRARAIGPAIIERALEIGADLVVLGSAPRWRRQSRFFSPTVDYVLRKAPCEVLIVAFPQSVMDEELAAT
jgi:APA family basic amino acid/polyamine antiporter